MIDPSIITRGAELAQLQQQQNMEALGNLGGNLGRLVLGRRINQMRQLDGDNERKAFANDSIFAPYLNETLRADQVAAQKAQQEALKFNADLYNTYAQGEERIANAGKYKADAGKTNQETGGSRYNLGQSVFMAVAASGSPEAGKAVLNRQLSSGAIDQTTYDSINNQLNGMIGQKPSDIQSLAFNQAKAMLDPKFNFQTKDNEATVNATLNGQNLDYKLGEAKLKQDNDQFKKNFEYTAQQDEIKNGQGEVREFNGKAYIVYKNGDSRPLVGEDGQQLSASGSKGMTEQQSKDALFGSRMQQANNILDALEKESVSAPFLNHTGKLGEAAAQVLPSFLGGASSKQQQYVQAQRDFINAVLRKESGAVIGEEEFENAKKQYFPQPGDSDAVIKQKAQNRKLALNMIVQSSGSTGQEAIKAGVAASSTPTFSRAAVAQAAKQRGVTVEQVQREIEARGGQVR
ncbi:hypothetical protein [Acinetobacter junii]|uniref:hypothetical protein n=1 Tax=Acinetobacter junii TaxID=40215 RepID=UPI001250585D|nr:hypothetical protein [Acinetobacter junii]